MNALKTLTGVLRNRYLGTPVPVAMTIALTYRCNLRCRYCQIWKEAGAEMSTGQVISAMDELSDAGMARLGFTGGEPLLREDIGTLVTHAKDRGLFTSIFTNGALVDGHLETLSKLDVVLMSLDGPREVHDAMRGEGAWDKAMHALSVLSDAGVKVWTNTVVTNRNVDVVDWVLDTAERHGAHAAFQPIFEHSYSVSGDRVAGYRAEKTQYSALIDHLLDRKREGAPLLNSPLFLHYVKNPIWRENPRKCMAARVYGAVAPDGKVAPCPILLQMTGLPSGLKVGFAEAFRRTRSPRECRGCFCIATVESDFLFSFRPGAVVSTARYLVEEQVRLLRGRPHVNRR